MDTLPDGQQIIVINTIFFITALKGFQLRTTLPAKVFKSCYNPRMEKSNNKSLFFDILIIFISICLAVILVKTKILENILTSTKDLEILGSFIAGIFFTSIFTVAPATITLGQVAAANSLFLTAVFGAAGALIGDLIIFKFVRDSISEHLKDTIKNKTLSKSMSELYKFRIFRWSTFFLSGLILASPLPDELGISLLGFLKIKTKWFVYISFVFNFIGILLVGLVAKSL